MDIQQLKAARAQLLYEFGEIEYERNLHIQRLQVLDKEYDSKIADLQNIENEMDRINNSIEKFSKSELYIEKNDENSLKCE